jgi:hypothetical protein
VGFLGQHIEQCLFRVHPAIYQLPGPFTVIN